MYMYRFQESIDGRDTRTIKIIEVPCLPSPPPPPRQRMEKDGVKLLGVHNLAMTANNHRTEMSVFCFVYNI